MFQPLVLKQASPLRRMRDALELKLVGSRKIPVEIPELGLTYRVQTHSLLGRLIRQNGMYEEDIVNWITSRYAPDSEGVFVDVGANFGWYSCLFGKIAGRSGKLFLFEPELTNLSLLKDNLALNGIENYTLFEAAVGSSAGSAVLKLAHRSNPGAHTLIDGGYSSGSVRVPVVTLDDKVLPMLGNDRVTLMKIDIEGFELEALRGGSALLERTDAIILEYSPPFLRRGGYNPIELWDLLVGRGFRALEWKGGNDPVAIDAPPETDQCNLLFMR